jgi:hypothetical protein
MLMSTLKLSTNITIQLLQDRSTKTMVAILLLLIRQH